MKTVYLLDGNWLFWRAYHAPFRNLSVPCQCTERMNLPMEGCPDCNGTGAYPTKATFQFIRDLLKLIKTEKPHYLAVVFDGKRSNLRRRQIYPDYKSNRKDGELWDVKPQKTAIKRIVKALGLLVVQCDGYEADDAIATLAAKFASPDRKVVIVTRDKDLMSLTANPQVVVFDALSGVWYDSKRVSDKYGVPPSLMPDFLALQGDKSDNIPNVPGWGEKKTSHWIRVFNGGVDVLLRAARLGSLPGVLGKNLLTADKDGSLSIARKLVALDTDVELYLKRVDLRVPDPLNLKKAKMFFRAFGFRSLLD